VNASLYEAGWRQGSIMIVTLPFDAVVLDPSGQVVRELRDHAAGLSPARSAIST
jgi:hypothetical protein